MTVKLLTEQHLEFLSLKGGCTGSSESTLVKMPHCWKSHFKAHIIFPEQMHPVRSPFQTPVVTVRNFRKFTVYYIIM